MLKNIVKHIIFLFVGLFIFLVLSSSFFHHHPITLEEQPTCPVHIFQTTLMGATFVFISFFMFSSDRLQGLLGLTAFYIPTKIISYQIISRAPPSTSI